MPEQIKITIHPPQDDSALLSVKDAMEQILDFFALATPDDDIQEGFGWRLISASTNTPLTVSAEAYGLRGESVDSQAIAMKSIVAAAIHEIKEGRQPSNWTTGEKNKIAKRIAKRNINGIAKTEIFLDDNKVEIITPPIAEQMIWLLSKPREETTINRERKEIGSIEGVILRVGTHYNKPALYVVDRLSKREIWCEIADELQDDIAENTSFIDVWQNRRVKIRGLLQYDKEGNLSKVYAREVILKPFKSVSVNAITDASFTGGLSPEEYLNKFREGDLG